MHLFNYIQLEAQYLLQKHRNDITHSHISNEHWDLVRIQREAASYDREAYEHVLQLGNLFLEQCVTLPNGGGEIIRLGGLLKDVGMVKEIAGLDFVPVVVEVVGREEVTARLCKVDGVAKGSVREWLDLQRVLGTGEGKKR